MCSHLRQRRLLRWAASQLVCLHATGQLGGIRGGCRGAERWPRCVPGRGPGWWLPGPGCDARGRARPSRRRWQNRAPGRPRPSGSPGTGVPCAWELGEERSQSGPATQQLRHGTARLSAAGPGEDMRLVAGRQAGRRAGRQAGRRAGSHLCTWNHNGSRPFRQRATTTPAPWQSSRRDGCERPAQLARSGGQCSMASIPGQIHSPQGMHTPQPMIRSQMWACSSEGRSWLMSEGTPLQHPLSPPCRLPRLPCRDRSCQRPQQPASRHTHLRSCEGHAGDKSLTPLQLAHTDQSEAHAAGSPPPGR